MNPIALTAIALLLPTFAGAQALYRCGNTYSQTPCAANAAPVRARADSVADSAPGPKGGELCAAAAAKMLHLPDPESVRIESVEKAPAEVIQYADKPTAAHKYIVSINAKNVYGAYEGTRAYACHLSEDERRILKFAAG